MLVELDNQFRFPIPFAHILLAEKQAVQRIHHYRLHNERLTSHDNNEKRKQLLGELKMSDRQTVIILCYLLTIMSELKSKSEEIPRTVFYLCKNEQRREWLLRAIDRIMVFLDREFGLVEDRPHIRDIKVYDESRDVQIKQEKEKSSHKQRRLFVMPVSKYMSLKLQLREYAYWENNPDPCIELSESQNITLLKYCKNIDYLFAETNDLQGMLEQTLSASLSQVIINRAWMELSKLNRFYNYRFSNKIREKAKSAKKTQTRQNQPIDVKRHLEQENMEQIKKEADGLPQVKKKFFWRIQNYDSKFTQLAKVKKTEMQNKNHYVRVDRSLPKYLQCYFLVHLQAITHILSYLVSTSRQKEATQNSDFQIGTQQYISQMCKKINIPASAFRKFRRILRSFMQKYPPKIMDKQLEVYYLEQVLRYVEKIVIWQEIFGKNKQDDTLINKFWVFKFKHQFEVQIALSKGSYCRRVKEQQYKLTTFDQKLMFQLLSDGVRSLSCYQNQGYCFDYYEQIFRPNKRLNISIEYRCPTVVYKDMKAAVIGMIINSTPNDEDLHIHSDKPHWSLQLNEVEDKKFDRQNYSQIIRSYGVLIYDLCEAVPDGIVVYFPTRQILRECRAEWQSMESIYQRIYQKKRIFQEVEDEKTNINNLALYRKLCDKGRGAVFFISAQSEFGKNQTFFNHYSKSILFVGVPYYPLTIEVDHKIRQLKLKQMFRFEIAMRIVARCLSNCINNPAQIKIVLFADASFGNFDIRKKWFPFIEEGNVNTSDVIEKVRKINSKTYTLLMQRKNQEEQLLLRREPSFTSFRQ